MSGSRFAAYILPWALLAAAAAAIAAPAGSAATAEAEGEARAVLRKAVLYHRQAQDLVFRFEAEVRNADLDQRDTYRGRLLLKDSTRFRLEVPGGTYVSDGATFWEYHPKHNQVVIRSAADMAGQALPGAVLLRFLDAEPISVSRVNSGGREVFELRLDPARAMRNLDSLSVQLDRKDHSLRRVASRDVNGNENVYTLLAVKRNGGIKDREFAFTPPKGVEVVDMR